MYENKIVLCGANSYEEKYYLNPDFEELPDTIKDELKIMCVLYVHDVGGILTLVYEENGELCFEVTSEEFDPMFDDIGSQLKIKQLKREKQDLLQSLQLYYKVFFLGEELSLLSVCDMSQRGEPPVKYIKRNVSRVGVVDGLYYALLSDESYIQEENRGVSGRDEPVLYRSINGMDWEKTGVVQVQESLVGLQ